MSLYTAAHHLSVLDDEVTVVIIPTHGVADAVDKLFRTIRLHFNPLGKAEGVRYSLDRVQVVRVVELVRRTGGYSTPEHDKGDNGPCKSKCPFVIPAFVGMQ